MIDVPRFKYCGKSGCQQIVFKAGDKPGEAGDDSMAGVFCTESGFSKSKVLDVLPCTDPTFKAKGDTCMLCWQHK
jgi:hypothetical protein